MPTEYGIRPYVNMVNDDNEETPYIDMMKAPTWAYALAQEVQKFSEFMKPYLSDGDYPDMESNYPTYSLDNPNPGDTISPGPLYPTGPHNPNLPHSTCPCCFEVLNEGCFPPEDVNGGRFFSAEHPYNAYTHHWSIKGDYKNVHIQAPYYSPAGWIGAYHHLYFDFDQAKVHTNGFAYVDLCYTILGVCTHCVELWAPCSCCLDPEYVVMTFDNASTPDTIARSTGISCFVLDGCGPYSWAVSGTGFTFTAATTSGKSNTLNASGTACGTATCTVTDDCGTVVTFYVLCTTGHWHSIGNCSANDPGGATCWPSSCPSTPNPTLVYRDDKYWSIQRTNTCYEKGARGTWRNPDASACSLPLPPCGQPAACSGATCSCGAPGATCYMVGFTYSTWNC